jgi:hypothetical protein
MSVGPVNDGFNQSGGAYYMVLQNLETVGDGSTGSYINRLATAGSNSGGAWVSPTLVPVSMSTILGNTGTAGATGQGSTLVAAGALLRDMGKTVVSSVRVFRKFAPVVAAGTFKSSFGVIGQPALAPNTGYGSFYLEIGREGTGVPAPIVRYV